MDTGIETLLNEARAAREAAFAPYSNFRVGAAIETESGRIFRGCNVENGTFGLTTCAERVALVGAIAAGERRFTRVAIVTDTEQPTVPCGSCRQLLWEFCGDIPLHMITLSGRSARVQLAALFPEPFNFSPEPT